MIICGEDCGLPPQIQTRKTNNGDNFRHIKLWFRFDTKTSFQKHRLPLYKLNGITILWSWWMRPLYISVYNSIGDPCHKRLIWTSLKSCETLFALKIQSNSITSPDICTFFDCSYHLWWHAQHFELIWSLLHIRTIWFFKVLDYELINPLWNWSLDSAR